MATRIRVTAPSALLEASRALQAANRRRLEGRNREGHVIGRIQTAARREESGSAAAIWRSRPGLDPWRGAVPEYEQSEIQRARRSRPQIAVGYLVVKQIIWPEVFFYKPESMSWTEFRRYEDRRDSFIRPQVELSIYSANGLASLKIPEYNYRDKIPVPFDGNVTREYYTSSYLTGYSGEEFDFPASIPRDIKGDLYNIYYASTGDKEGITNNRFYNLPNNDDPRTYFDSGIATNMDFSQLWTSQAPIEMYYSHPFTFLLPLPVARNKMIAVLVRGNLNYHLSQYRTAQVDCFLIGPSTVRQLQTPAALQQWGNSFQLPNYGPGTTAEAVTDDPLTWGKWGKLPSYSIAQGVGTRSLSPYNQNLPAYIAGVHTYENVWHVATAGTAQAMDTILGRPATYSPRWLELDKVPSTNSVTARLINTVDPQTGQPLNLSGGAKVPGISFPLSLSIPLSELEPPSDVYWRQLYLSGFKQSRVATQPRSVPFVAWDWGNPGYCRARLLELGFSEADLIP